MEIKITKPKNEKKLVGRLDSDGTLFLRFESLHVSKVVNTVTLGNPYDNGVVKTNGSAPIENINGTPIYEGDEITIKF